jgi:hypothetical protein
VLKPTGSPRRARASNRNRVSLFRDEEWIHKPRVTSVGITSTTASRSRFRELVHTASHVYRTPISIRDP